MSIFKAKFVTVQYKNSNIKKKISKVFYKSSRNYFVSPWIEIPWTKAKTWKNERIVEFQGSNKTNFSCHNCTLNIYERFVNLLKLSKKRNVCCFLINLLAKTDLRGGGKKPLKMCLRLLWTGPYICWMDFMISLRYF